jgi:hypothetical protein
MKLISETHRWISRGQALWTTLSVGAVLLAYLVLLPRILIVPTAVPQPSDPFSGFFRITNNQFYSLRDVSMEASLWCAAIGGPNSNPPPIKNKDCMQSMKTAKPDWHDHTLEPDEGWEISLANLFAVWPSTALRYADIVITVHYRPWFWPFQNTRDFRFFTRRLNSGGIEWLAKPLDKDQVPAPP